jgi:D-alanyl-D-alanine carboxypeptidase (penicillin-binding protein 5/6)
MSGGDAAVTLAEKLAGSESSFAGKMRARAREIGMPLSTFGNATGLPHPDNMMTSRELARLSEYLITEHKDLYPMFATRRFEFGAYQNEWCAMWGANHTVNYNKLLFIMPGADGLKTGHTENGGYGMTASAMRGGRRLIGVLNGFRTKGGHNALAAEMKRLLEYGFETTINRNFYTPGDEIVRVPVWYGRQPDVAATVATAFAATIPRESAAGADGNAGGGLRVTARYKTPAAAPVRAGDRLGEIVAELDGRVIAKAPLVAKHRVGKARFIGRIWLNIKIILGIN